jgi:hypothetical protein
MTESRRIQRNEAESNSGNTRSAGNRARNTTDLLAKYSKADETESGQGKKGAPSQSSSRVFGNLGFGLAKKNGKIGYQQIEDAGSSNQ